MVQTTATSAAVAINNSSPTQTLAFDVRVQAHNAAGWSGWSPSARVEVPPLQKPAAPAAPTVTRSAGSVSTSLDVSWDAPTDDGGGDIDDYDLNDRTAAVGSTPAVTVQNPNLGNATELTLANLVPATRYEVRVRAENNAGPRSWSA